MTRLSLHSRDENPKLSIRLLVGQYCTVGSSAAADYQFRGDGIDPVHCRIGCRPTGGYIECLDLNSRIVVNGESKDRSRLTHGNTVKIGSVEMDVEMPGLDIGTGDFEVNFEEEEAPTAKVSDAVAYDQRADETANEAKPESAAPNSTENDTETAGSEGHDLSVVKGKAPEPSEARGEIHSDDSNRPQPVDSSDADSEQTSSEAKVPVPTKIDPPPAANSPKRPVTFEFDSGDPDDVELSQSEIDKMTQTSPIENVMGSVDLESELESESVSDVEQSAPSGQIHEETADVEAAAVGLDSLRLEGGFYTDKHWKWTNSRAIAALKRILDHDKGLNIYQCDIKQIKSVEIDEYSLRWFKKQKCVVYLISHLDETEINSLVRSKRWDERIGHPQAVTMFLALSPKRIVGEFFASIKACLLYSEEFELLRESDGLDR